VPGRDEQHVAFAQRHLEVVGEREDELGAGAGPARLDEAQVARRDTDVEREVHLAAVAAEPPVAHERADRVAGHPGTVGRRTRRLHYPRGSRDGAP
jgi:hypothetical protein